MLLKNIIPQILQDAYKRLFDNNINFAISEVYERCKDNNIGFSQLGINSQYTPTLVVVSGSRRNISAVTSYGEGEQADICSRKPLDIIKQMAGTENIINMQEPKSTKERQKIKPFLTEANYLAKLYQSTQDCFADMFANWDYSISFQDAISHTTINVIANNVFGIPSIDKTGSKLLRTAGQVLREDKPTSNNFLDLQNKMQELNKKLLSLNKKNILTTENYIKEKAEINDHASDTENMEKLLHTHGISNLLVENNLSFLIMVGMIYVHQSTDILEKIRTEIENVTSNDLATIRKLPYLDCIYKESLRFASPTPMIIRETSKPTKLSICNENGNSNTYHVGSHALFFAPIRRIHHDPRYWAHPEQFDPARFLEPSASQHFFPFSLGKRSCPAASSFNEIVFKTALIASLNYDFKLDKQVEEIPANSLDSRWKQEYYLATITERGNLSVRKNL